MTVASEIRAAMAGKILEIPVAVGEHVDTDADLIIIESMKMEIPVAAPASGLVRGIHVSVGDAVQEGDLLITLDAG